MDNKSGVCSFATQCLKNAIFLCDQSLPQATDTSSSSQEASRRSSDATAETSDALQNPSSGLPNPNSGLTYPSNGHRGRLGSTKEGSAAEAAEQLAMLSLDRSRASTGKLIIVNIFHLVTATASQLATHWIPGKIPDHSVVSMPSKLQMSVVVIACSTVIAYCSPSLTVMVLWWWDKLLGVWQHVRHG